LNFEWVANLKIFIWVVDRKILLKNLYQVHSNEFPIYIYIYIYILERTDKINILIKKKKKKKKLWNPN